jgi:hypothetical protein
MIFAESGKKSKGEGNKILNRVFEKKSNCIIIEKP